MSQVLQKYLPIDPPDPLSTDEDTALLSLTPSSLPTFSLPPIANPTSFLRTHIDEHVNPNCHIKLAHGTTTLAFRFNGGIVVAVDSRATAGNWIASQTVKKGILFIDLCFTTLLLPLPPFLYYHPYIILYYLFASASQTNYSH